MRGSLSDQSSISTKGSLLVFPKVELKWDENRDLVQDTFIEITNDYPGDVRVQLYFINGDQLRAPMLVGDPPILVERGHPGCNAVDAFFPRGKSCFSPGGDRHRRLAPGLRTRP